MIIQYVRLRAEMEVSSILQKVIVVHHIIQVLGPVVCIVICAVAEHFILMRVQLSHILPTFVFIIFWIASKCNYQDLSRILVHFNFILSMLWFISIFQAFLISFIFHYDLAPIVVSIINGILMLSSAIFAVYGIWKAARNVVLNANLARGEHVDEFNLFPFQSRTFTDHNVMSLPQVTHGPPISTQ